MNDKERAQIQYMCSDPDKSAEVASFVESDLMSECLLNDTELKLFGKARKIIP